MERRALGISLVLAVAGCDRVFQLDLREAIDAPPDAFSPYQAAVLADMPLAYWRFGADSPAVAVDETGTTPGIYQGPVTPTAAGALISDPDTAAAFDGVGAFVDMSNRLGFAGTVPFSIEAWVNPTFNGTYNGVLSKNDETGGGATKSGYHMYVDTTSFGFDRSNGINAHDVRTAALATNRWTYVVVTFDGAALRLYVDGLEAATTTATPPIVLPATSKPFVVGARNGGQYQFFRGAIDELAVYDHVLTPAQINAHRLVALDQ